MLPRLALFSLAALAAVPTETSAVVILNGNGTANFADPGAGLPWANVGKIGGASGVYLGDFGGNYWVLTAAHVGAGNIILGSTTYDYVGGSALRVLNADSSPTDLTLFRISSSPGLPSLNLSTSDPAALSNVYFVGYGSIEGAAIYWSVNTATNPDTWTEVTSADPYNAAGYAWTTAAGKRWGVARVTGTNSYTLDTVTTSAVVTEFVNTSGYSQAATGDSGGATFFYDGSTWHLAGIMGAIGTHEGQPGATAVLGDLTYSASMATYRGFVLTAIPEPAAFGAWLGAAAGLSSFLLRRLRRRR